MDTEIGLLIWTIDLQDWHDFLFDHTMFFSNTELQLLYVSGAFSSDLIVRFLNICGFVREELLYNLVLSKGCISFKCLSMYNIQHSVIQNKVCVAKKISLKG